MLKSQPRFLPESCLRICWWQMVGHVDFLRPPSWTSCFYFALRGGTAHDEWGRKVMLSCSVLRLVGCSCAVTCTLLCLEVRGPISHGLSFVPSKRSLIISANLQLKLIERLWMCMFLRGMWGWLPRFPSLKQLTSLWSEGESRQRRAKWLVPTGCC